MKCIVHDLDEPRKPWNVTKIPGRLTTLFIQTDQSIPSWIYFTCQAHSRSILLWQDYGGLPARILLEGRRPKIVRQCFKRSHSFGASAVAVTLIFQVMTMTTNSSRGCARPSLTLLECPVCENVVLKRDMQQWSRNTRFTVPSNLVNHMCEERGKGEIEKNDHEDEDVDPKSLLFLAPPILSL